MNLPPQDIPPSSLFLKLMERPQPSEVLPVPVRSTNGTALPDMRIMVLRDEQRETARIRARDYLKKKRQFTDDDFRTPLGIEMLGDAVARECIAMASYMADPIEGTEDNPKYPLLFRSAEDVSKLGSDEIVAIFGAYCMVQKKYAPNERELTDEEVNAWIERLEVGASEFPLSQLPSHRRDELCMRLAKRAFTFSQCLVSLRESSPPNLESVPESWAFITGSFTAHAASSSRSDDDGLITQEAAMAAVNKITGRE